ncbi:MAG: DUF1700 domain-containing protein [Eubacteriales bacterium]|nr:DUF1700 domain-containing protein [Eubacteriales bacterium]
MTKQDYLSQLKSELKRNGVSDAEDIVSEYEQHFLFKLADGFSEEEIAAKLASPESIASQFAGIRAEGKHKKRKKGLLVLWLTLIGIFEGMLYAAFLSFTVGLLCGSLVPTVLGAELIAGLNFMNILPPMPYGGAIVFGVMMIALGVMLFLFAVYCFAFLRQMMRASLRWRKNMVDDEALPLLPMSPQFSPKARRTLRSVLLWAVLIFGITFITGYTILGLYTHSMGFWHALGWFGYPATVY